MNTIRLFLLAPRLKIVLLCHLLLVSSIVFGQTVISGKVTNEIGTPLSGVSIQIKNESNSTTTDLNGNYTINFTNDQNPITFTYVGYDTFERLINSDRIINVELIPIQNSLQEVVITGYSAQQKKDIIGSVSVVDKQALEKQTNVSVDRSLQGLASGVNVVSSGVPGSASKINIRGLSSFGDTNPLVIVDGIEQNLTHINPNDIESIQVLKDAGAAAIYGVRGANGIIIISTKKGKTGKPNIQYEGSLFTNHPLSGNVYDLMNSYDYMDVYNIAFPGNPLFSNGMPDYTYRGPSGAGVGNEGDPQVNPELYFYEKKNTGKNYIIQKVNKDREDWFHNLFQKATSNQHAISVNGGTDYSKYYFGLGYTNQNGTMFKSHYERYNARVNTEFKLGKHIKVGENISLIYRNVSGGGNGLATAYMMLPIVPLRDIAGNYAGSFGGPNLGSFANNVANQDRNSNDLVYDWGLAGNTFLEASLIKGLTFRTSIGINYNTNYDRDFTGTQTENVQGSSADNSLDVRSGYNNTLTFTNTLTYNTIINKHNIQVLLGSEAIKYTSRSLTGSATAFFSEDENYLNVNNGTLNRQASSSVSANSLYSLFSRFDYSYDNKYLVSGTLRRDGSSKFGFERKFGVFPSFSFGWRLSEEPFLKNQQWIDDLKIRGSWGVLGSQNNVNANNAYSLYASSIAGTSYDISGTSTSVVQGFGQSRIGNAATGWEENILTNIGFDISFLNKFSLTAEYYMKKINGLLFTEPLPATILGGATAPTINIGDIQNNGIDATFSYNQKINDDFKFNVGLNFTTYKNKIVDLPGPGFFLNGNHEALGSLTRNEEGEAMSSFYGYKVIGIFNSQEEVDNSPTQTAAQPGRFKYQDTDNDGKITPEDRVLLGNPNPDYTYGLNLGIDYKRFDFSALLYGSQGNDILNTTRTYLDFMSYYQGAKSNRLKNAWTPENTNTNVPKLEATRSFSTVGANNSYFVEDGSFLKLRHITLGYSIPNHVLNKVGISKIRVYGQATNLFTKTKYSGLDPEIASGDPGIFGVDNAAYPNNELGIIFGLSASF